jgi:hypothetical protein
MVLWAYMNALIIVGVVAGLPVLLALVFRVSSAMVFLSVATGALLQRTLHDSTTLALAALVKDGPVSDIANGLLLGLPVVLTLLFLRKSMPKKEVLLHLLPLVAAGAALGALVLPLLSSQMVTVLKASSYGQGFVQSADVIVAVAAGLNLALAWRVYRHKGESSKHHGKHI